MPKFVADSSVSPQGLKWAVDPVADVVTTAGDLIYGTAADTVARLGIGTASQVLAVNSGATAPEWVTPAAGGFVGVGVKKTSTQSISNSTDTALTFDAEDFDAWHNQIKEQLNLPKMSVNISGELVPDAVINTAYTQVHHIAENDYRALVADQYADGLEVSDNPFPSNYTN